MMNNSIQLQLNFGSKTFLVAKVGLRVSQELGYINVSSSLGLKGVFERIIIANLKCSGLIRSLENFLLKYLHCQFIVGGNARATRSVSRSTNCLPLHLICQIIWINLFIRMNFSESSFNIFWSLFRN